VNHDRRRAEREGATLSAIRSLIQAWDADVERPIELVNRHNNATPQLIWTLANHATEATRTVVDLAAKGRMLVAMPLVRLALEAAVTCQWLSIDPGGAGAVFAEALRQRQVAVRAATARGEKIPQALMDDDAEWTAVLEPLRSKAGRQMQDRFLTLPAGEMLYAEYRRASNLCHAGLALASEYMDATDPEPDNPAGVAFSHVSVLADSDRWALVALTNLMRAYNVVDEIDVGHRLRPALGEASTAAVLLAASLEKDAEATGADSAS
jgi:hypothetical protein